MEYLADRYKVRYPPIIIAGARDISLKHITTNVVFIGSMPKYRRIPPNVISVEPNPPGIPESLPTIVGMKYIIKTIGYDTLKLAAVIIN